MFEGTRLARPRRVTGEGAGLVSHAGLVLVARVADAAGLTGGFFAGVRSGSWRRYHPARVLCQVVLALVDGARCVSDVAMLHPAVVGPVPSVASLWRILNTIGSIELRGIARAVTGARERVWRATGPATPFIIDLDATLVTCRTNKHDAAPTWKRSFGYHPLLAVDAARGEVLTVMLRPGNAGSNTASDHVIVLRQAIDALPATERAGHQPGDDPAKVQVSGLVRADAAGASHWLAEECRDRNLTFSVGFFCDGRVRDALLWCQEEDWTPAVEAGGRRRAGAYVIELTGLVNLSGWPTGTRLICRRERPHPGAQLSLFDDHEGWRHTCFLTDQTDRDIAALECRHRQRGRAETVIRDVKACGLDTMPSNDVVNNELWAQLAACALNLCAWTRQTTLDHTGLARATPKTLRYRLFHTAGRHHRHRLDLDRDWPHTPTITTALHRLDTRLPPPTVTGRQAA